MVGQALHAGLEGDMVQALYMLVPQFDHMIRKALHATASKTQQAPPIATVPIKDPRVNELLGEGLTLAFQGVLCDDGGAGLRQAVLEGRADKAVCKSPQAVYGWWLMLQLVMETGAIARANQADRALPVTVAGAQGRGEGAHD